MRLEIVVPENSAPNRRSGASPEIEEAMARRPAKLNVELSVADGSAVSEGTITRFVRFETPGRLRLPKSGLRSGRASSA